MEKWKDISGLEGLYQVSNYGRLKRLPRVDCNNHKWNEQILKAATQTNGYKVLHVSINGEHKRILVHRAVAEAFCIRPDGCNIVNHLDNDPSNNRADNLEWTTYKGNMQHAAKQGRMASPSSATIEASAKKKRIGVIATDENGNERHFKSQAEAAAALGINRRHIPLLCRKEYGYKKSKGYSLRYADEERRALAIPKKTAMPENERRESIRAKMMGNQNSKGVPCSQKAKDASIAKFGKPVLQYDADMNLVAEYPSANTVRKQLGYSIDYALKYGKKCHGFYWRYKNG